MRTRGKLALTVTTAAALAAFGVWTAQAATNSDAAAADAQPSSVETFEYPGAAAIQQNYGVTLISGDGHILFADCATPPSGNIGLLKVRTTEGIGAAGNGLICFKVLAGTGRLDLKIPAVYEIRGDGLSSGAGHKVKADLTTDAGAHSTVDVNPSGSTPVGVGADPNNAPTTLLQLTATP